MIEINLLGGTPPKTPRTPLAIPTRPILYGVLALVVGLAALEYLPGYLEETMAPPPATPSIDDILAEAERLREELVSRQPPPTPEPAPVVPEPEPAPVVPEPVAEATPPPPDPPAPDPIPIANDGLASLLRKSADVVTTFTVLNAAVPPGSHYELLSVGTERFVTELWVPERILLEKYQAAIAEGTASIRLGDRIIDAGTARQAQILIDRASACTVRDQAKADAKAGRPVPAP